MSEKLPLRSSKLHAMDFYWIEPNFTNNLLQYRITVKLGYNEQLGTSQICSL